MARLIDADALIAPLKLQMESYDRIGACERAEAYRNCIWEINEAPTIDGWISVKDRLPDDEYECLVITEDNWYYIGFFYGLIQKWIVDGGVKCDEEVTHWIKLPEPPKEASR